MKYPCKFFDIPSIGSRVIMDTRICLDDAEADVQNYVPHQRWGGGGILVSVRIPGVGVSVTVWYPPYLLNQWVEFYQTCRDTSLGQTKSWLSFGDSDPIFKVIGAQSLLNFVRRRDRFLYPRYSWTNGWNVTKLAWIYHWDKLKIWLDFGDLDRIFKITEDFNMWKNH